MKQDQKKVMDTVIVPLNGRILFRRDASKKETKGGIALPDSAKIDVITGRVLEISPDLQKEGDCPVSQYDKVLIQPGRAVPVDLEDIFRGETGGTLFLVPFEDIVAVFKRKEEDEEE